MQNNYDVRDKSETQLFCQHLFFFIIIFFYLLLACKSIIWYFLKNYVKLQNNESMRFKCQVQV